MGSPELIKRSADQETRRKSYPSISNMPEEIVRQYRRSQCAIYDFAPRRPKIRWYRKIDWNVAAEWTCWAILGGVAFYLIIGMIIPFVRMLRWQ